MTLVLRKLLSRYTHVTLTYSALGFSLLSLTACATMKKTDASLANVGSEASISQNARYVDVFPEVSIAEIARSTTKDTFKIGDTADITVYNVESLTGTYVVDRIGNINFPLIGVVKVAGLSTIDLQKILTESYGTYYLRNPNINVKLDAQDLGRVVVDGAVNKPGVFEIDRIIRLSEAIALAEGLGEDANGSSVFIIRTINGEAKIKEVNLKDVRKLGAPDPQIIPDDVIFVQDSTGRVVFREFIRAVPLLNTALIFGAR